jgi:succinyl-diaminopimelate desuccinylase
MTLHADIVEQLQAAVNQERLVNTAVQLIDVPSPTGTAKAALDTLDAILTEEGLEVERPDADYPQSPAVAARLKSLKPGRTLQFQGHLDTVHLPFVPARVEDGTLYGSGAADMKGGVAAMVEAMRALRDTDLLPGGEILITSTDMHEAPWGQGEQIRGLVQAGYVGDGVLIPEYLYDRLPVIGRAMAVLDVHVRREGQPVHEVLGGIEQPNVISAGAELVRRFEELDGQLAAHTHPFGGRESLFIGTVQAGEMFNQSPIDFHLQGTRRWLPGTDRGNVEQQFRDVLQAVAQRDGIAVDGDFMFLSGPFQIDQSHPLLPAFQSAYQAATGASLPLGGKPLLDDGNTIINFSDAVPITHGPNGLGAHTVEEEVAVAELVRVALVYALTAVCFCGEIDNR